MPHHYHVREDLTKGQAYSLIHIIKEESASPKTTEKRLWETYGFYYIQITVQLYVILDRMKYLKYIYLTQDNIQE